LRHGIAAVHAGQKRPGGGEDFGNDMKNNQPQRTQRTQRVLGFFISALSALQYVRILARCDVFPERGCVWKTSRSNADWTEIGKGMNGSGMKHGFSLRYSSAVHSPAFTSGGVGLRLGRAVFFAGK